MICGEFFCLIEPHLEYLRGVFDGRLSKPGHLTPIAGHFSNFEGVDVLHRLAKKEVLFPDKSAKRA